MAYTTSTERRQRRRRQRIRGQALSWVATMLMAFTIGGLFAFVLVEWIAGCGQVFYYPDGTWKTGQCVFMDALHPVKSGTWK